jgi:hypothetical protein
MRTNAVTTRTTLLVVRSRFHLDLPGSTGPRSLVTEDAQTLAFDGSPANAVWLDSERVAALLAAEPSGNVPVDVAEQAFTRIIDGLAELTPHLDDYAEHAAAELLDAHRRVREGARAARAGLSVRAERPVDIVGIYVLLPTAA